jgi:HEPN domain-containing protein
MNTLIKDWVDYAKDDLEIARELLKSEFCPTRDIVSHCQQAIEKYFKAFLIENGWELQRTHNLVFLYKEILKIKDFSLSKDLLIQINDRFETVRYPDGFDKPREEEAREYYKFALEVKSKIEYELK